MSPPTTPPARTRRYWRLSSPPMRGRTASYGDDPWDGPCQRPPVRTARCARCRARAHGNRRERRVARARAAPLRGGDLRPDGAHRGRRVGAPERYLGCKLETRRRRRWQAHARPGLRARARRGRPAPGAGRRGLDLAADRARHCLHARRAARARRRGSDARPRPPRRRRAPADGGCGARMLARGGRRCARRRRGQLRRHQVRARSARRRSWSTGRDSPTASRSSGSRPCSSRASCASSARSWWLCSRTICGASPRPTA